MPPLPSRRFTKSRRSQSWPVPGLEDLIFYRNVSLYLYSIHIPEILAQTLLFGYSLVWLEKAAAQRGLQTLPSLSVPPVSATVA